MTVFERIEYLRKKEGISQGNLEKELKMSNGSISKWKTSMPKPERLQKVADHFGVTIDFLMEKTNTVTCKECDMCYNPLDEESVKDHEKIHQKMNDAKEKYGFYFDAEYCMYKENDCLNVLNNINAEMPASDIVRIYESYLKCCFSDELRRKLFSIKYDSFEEYARNIILKDRHKAFMSVDMFDALCQKYEITPSYIDESAISPSDVSKNPQLMRLLAYAKKLNPEMLNMLEIQAKALAEQSDKE